jgi:RNA polymerase-binding transcription factor DksA
MTLKIISISPEPNDGEIRPRKKLSLSVYENGIFCDECGKPIAMGAGDLNCTSFLCTKCYEKLNKTNA